MSIQLPPTYIPLVDSNTYKVTNTWETWFVSLIALASATTNPSGSNGDVQFNEGNSFNGDSNFNYNSATKILTVKNGFNGQLTGNVTGNLIGNADTVTGFISAGYTLTLINDATCSGHNTGDQTDITGNAATVTNGVYTTDTGTVTDTMLAGSISNGKLANGAVANLSGTNTGDQTIALTGVVTGSGTGSFATSIGAGAITNTMLAGSISASKISGTAATGGGTCSGTCTGTNSGDQTITLTGAVTGSGTGTFATTIGAGAVTNSMLAGSIASSKLIGTDIAVIGTLTAGTVPYARTSGCANSGINTNITCLQGLNGLGSAAIAGSDTLPIVMFNYGTIVGGNSNYLTIDNTTSNIILQENGLFTGIGLQSFGKGLFLVKDSSAFLTSLSGGSTFYWYDSGSTALVGLKATSSGSASYTMILPDTIPAVGNVLTVTSISSGIATFVWATPAGGGTGTVTSVTYTGDGVLHSNTPTSPVTTSGTLTASLNTQTTKTFLAGPATGSPAAPTFRAIAAADVPTLNQNTSGSSASCTGNAATATTASGLSATLAVASGGTGVTTIGNCSIYDSTGTTLVHGATTIIKFNTARWDTNSWFDTTNHKYLPLLAGTYLVNAYINISTLANADYDIELFKNGSAIRGGQSFDAVSTTTAAIGLYLNCLVQCNGSTDYLQVGSFNGSGTNVSSVAGTFSSYFDIIRVGP